jgi:hypothetical protein
MLMYVVCTANPLEVLTVPKLYSATYFGVRWQHCWPRARGQPSRSQLSQHIFLVTRESGILLAGHARFCQVHPTASPAKHANIFQLNLAVPRSPANRLQGPQVTPAGCRLPAILLAPDQAEQQNNPAQTGQHNHCEQASCCQRPRHTPLLLHMPDSLPACAAHLDCQEDWARPSFCLVQRTALH